MAEAPSDDDRILGDFYQEFGVSWEKTLRRLGLPLNIGIVKNMTLREAREHAANRASKVASEAPMPTSRQELPKALADRGLHVLKDQHAVASRSDQIRFIDELLRSIQKRQDAARRCSQIHRGNDIIDLIQIVRDSGDLDEAVWRCFLAIHFGVSACSCADEEIHSASKLLCAFATKPYWTWERVSSDPPALRKWLWDHPADLGRLTYGNHRKYESKKPDGIWEVIESFLLLATKRAGPFGLVTLNPRVSDVQTRFDRLYYRILELRRFGRTGAFDFLVLLNDLKVIEAEPGKCYLEGASGPLDGATKLWGNCSIEELEKLAADFAKLVEVSPIAMEDALCNWQK